MKRKISSTHTTATNHKRNGRPSRGGEATEVRPFPARMPLGQFLFEYLHRRGVRHSFGVPGDFALPTFAWLEKSPIKSITMTHEPGAGFAADAYSRINGIGLVCVISLYWELVFIVCCFAVSVVAFLLITALLLKLAHEKTTGNSFR